MTTSPGSPLVSDRWLRPLRITWIVVLAVTLSIIAIALPIMYSQAHALCRQSSCNGPQLTRAQTASLHQLGLTLDLYGGFVVAVTLAFVLVYCATATLIFVRRSHERMALLSAFFLLVFGGLTFAGIPGAVADQYPAFRVPAALIHISGAVLLVLFFFLFPSGRFVPRWAPWLVPILPGLQAPGEFLPNSAWTLERLPAVIGIIPFYAILLITLVSQIYRYRKISTVSERQQTKWVVLGVGLALGFFLIFVALGATLPPSFQQGFLATAVPNTMLYLFMMLIPLSIALAILRYNLWETDLLINRTLVYGSLTVSLAGFYLLGVIAIQSLFRAVSGQSSDLAIAIATLAVAALFNPWRHRLQTFIDRRFYRHKYDATRMLTAFTARLRDDVDLNSVTDEMVEVIAYTVQPVTISVWLPGEVPP